MKKTSGKKPLPTLRSDAAAERFVDQADLSEYDLSGMIPMKFEFEEKSSRINIRIPDKLMEAVKDLAQEENMTYSRYIRLLIEAKVAEKGKVPAGARRAAGKAKKKTNTR